MLIIVTININNAFAVVTIVHPKLKNITKTFNQSGETTETTKTK